MAVYANLDIDQGSDYQTTITVEGSNGLPFDLTGYSARGQIRRNYTSTTAYNFTATITDPTDGEINIFLDHSVSAAMKAGRYLYDIEIVQSSSSDITRVIEGQVEINPRITR